MPKRAMNPAQSTCASPATGPTEKSNSPQTSGNMIASESTPSTAWLPRTFLMFADVGNVPDVSPQRLKKIEHRDEHEHERVPLEPAQCALASLVHRTGFMRRATAERDLGEPTRRDPGLHELGHDPTLHHHEHAVAHARAAPRIRPTRSRPRTLWPRSPR